MWYETPTEYQRWAVLGLAMLLQVFGFAAVKSFGQSPSLVMGFVAMLFGLIGSLLWLLSVRLFGGNVAQVGMLWEMGCLVIISVMGWGLYEEPFSVTNAVGLTLGVVAIILLAM